MTGRFVWLSVGRLSAALLQFALLILVARDVGPYLFGLFSIALGIIVVLQSVFDAGLSTFLVKLRAQEKAHPWLRPALRISSWLGLLLVIVCVMLSYAAAEILHNEALAPLAFLGLWAGAERAIEIRLGIHLADGDTRLNAAFLFGRRLASVALYFLLPAAFFPDLARVGAAFALSSVLALGLLLCVDSVRLPRSEVPTPLPAIVRSALPFWGNTIATQIRNLDSVALGFLAGPLTAGFYGMASRATTPLRLFTTSLAAVVLPEAARTSGRRKLRYRKLIRRVGLVVALLFTGFAAASPLVVGFVLGEEYAPAILPLQIVLIGLVFAGVSSMYNSCIQAWGGETGVARVSLLTSIAAILLVPIGGIVFGPSGAAVGLSLSFVVQCIWLRVFFTRMLADDSI